MKQDNYITKHSHRVCLNLTPLHFAFLREFTFSHFAGNDSLAIQYLLSKYLNPLYEIRIIPQRQTETAKYQPTTKQYKRYNVDINPTLWSKLFDLRRFVGYSISALIRIMLDWEMQSQGNNIIPLVEIPQINNDDIRNEGDETPDIPVIQNYSYTKSAFYQQRRVFSSFLDQFG
jgi:hypothetical protein